MKICQITFFYSFKCFIWIIYYTKIYRKKLALWERDRISARIFLFSSNCCSTKDFIFNNASCWKGQWNTAPATIVYELYLLNVHHFISVRFEPKTELASRICTRWERICWTGSLWAGREMVSMATDRIQMVSESRIMLSPNFESEGGERTGIRGVKEGGVGFCGLMS